MTPVQILPIPEALQRYSILPLPANRADYDGCPVMILSLFTVHYTNICHYRHQPGRLGSGYKLSGILADMKKIAIISSSIRRGRKSHRVALWFRQYLEGNNLAEAEILDLAEYNFPLFEERLKLQEDPLPQAVEFAGRIRSADGVIIVTPEYNGGYPASLKNAVDLLTDEWRRKPVAISTVSDGPFGGTQVITSLQFSLWKIGAWTVPAMFPVLRVDEAFDEEGLPADPDAMSKRAARFTGELLICIGAREAIDK